MERWILLALLLILIVAPILYNIAFLFPFLPSQGKLAVIITHFTVGAALVTFYAKWSQLKKVF